MLVFWLYIISCFSEAPLVFNIFLTIRLHETTVQAVVENSDQVAAAIAITCDLAFSKTLILDVAEGVILEVKLFESDNETLEFTQTPEFTAQLQARLRKEVAFYRVVVGDDASAETELVSHVPSTNPTTSIPSVIPSSCPSFIPTLAPVPTFEPSYAPTPPNILVFYMILSGITLENIQNFQLNISDAVSLSSGLEEEDSIYLTASKTSTSITISVQVNAKSDTVQFFSLQNWVPTFERYLKRNEIFLDAIVESHSWNGGLFEMYTKAPAEAEQDPFAMILGGVLGIMFWFIVLVLFTIYCKDEQVSVPIIKKISTISKSESYSNNVLLTSKFDEELHLNTSSITKDTYQDGHNNRHNHRHDDYRRSTSSYRNRRVTYETDDEYNAGATLPETDNDKSSDKFRDIDVQDSEMPADTNEFLVPDFPQYPDYSDPKISNGCESEVSEEFRTTPMPPQNRVSTTTPQMQSRYFGLSTPSSPQSSTFNVTNEIIHPLQPDSILHRHNRKNSYSPITPLRNSQKHSLSPPRHTPYEPPFKYKPIPIISLVDDDNNRETKNSYSITSDINHPKFTTSTHPSGKPTQKNNDNMLYNNPNKIPTLHSPLSISPIAPVQIKPDHTTTPFFRPNPPEYNIYTPAKSPPPTMSTTIDHDHYTQRTSTRNRSDYTTPTPITQDRDNSHIGSKSSTKNFNKTLSNSTLSRPRLNSSFNDTSSQSPSFLPNTQTTRDSNTRKQLRDSKRGITGSATSSTGYIQRRNFIDQPTTTNYPTFYLTSGPDNTSSTALASKRTPETFTNSPRNNSNHRMSDVTSKNIGRNGGSRKKPSPRKDAHLPSNTAWSPTYTAPITTRTRYDNGYETRKQPDAIYVSTSHVTTTGGRTDGHSFKPIPIQEPSHVYTQQSKVVTARGPLTTFTVGEQSVWNTPRYHQAPISTTRSSRIRLGSGSREEKVMVVEYGREAIIS